MSGQNPWIFSVLATLAVVSVNYMQRRYDPEHQNIFVYDRAHREAVRESVRSEPRLRCHFYDTYKVTVELFNYILGVLEPYLRPDSHNGISPESKLLFFFRVISTNDSLRSLVSDLQGNKDTINHAFIDVIRCLGSGSTLYNSWVYVASADVFRNAMQEFLQRLGHFSRGALVERPDINAAAMHYAMMSELKNCFGCVDGTVIRIAQHRLYVPQGQIFSKCSGHCRRSGIYSPYLH